MNPIIKCFIRDIGLIGSQDPLRHVLLHQAWFYVSLTSDYTKSSTSKASLAKLSVPKVLLRNPKYLWRIDKSFFSLLKGFLVPSHNIDKSKVPGCRPNLVIYRPKVAVY